MDITKLHNVYRLRRDDGSVCVYSTVLKSTIVYYDSAEIQKTMDENSATIIRLGLQFAAEQDKTAALEQRVEDLEAVARFIVNNRNNFTIRDTDGVAGRTIDQLAAALAKLEQP